MNTNNNQPVEWAVTQSEDVLPLKEESADTKVDPVTRKYHRHVVAIPLAMAALLHLHFGTHSATPAVLTGSLLGSSIEHIAEDRDVELPFNGSARVRAGAVFHVSTEKISLDDGSVLVKARGPVRITAGGITILLVRGSAVLSFSDGTLTVAALNAPLVLEQYGDRSLLPAGYQWRGQEVTGDGMFAIPADFLAEQETQLRTLSSVSSSKPLISLPSWNFGLLPGAERRKEEAKTLLLEQEVTEVLFDGNESYAKDLFFQMPEAKQLHDGIGAILGMEKLPSVAFLAATFAGIRSPNLLLLLSAHPDFESVVSGDISHDDVSTWLTRALMSDYGVLALSEHANLRAEAYVKQEILAAADDEAKSAVLTPVILGLTRTAKRANAVTLPERANALSMLAERLSKGHQKLLSDEAKQALAILGTIDRPEILPEPEVIKTESSASSASSTSSVSEITADEVIAATDSMLKSLKAMRSIETKIEAIAPHTAKVSGVYFAGGTGDNGVEFLYNTQKQEMYDIRLNGQLQPFPMDLQAFTKWVRGN